MRVRTYLGAHTVAASFLYALCGIVVVLATIWLLLLVLVVLFPPGAENMS